MASLIQIQRPTAYYLGNRACRLLHITRGHVKLIIVVICECVVGLQTSSRHRGTADNRVSKVTCLKTLISTGSDAQMVLGYFHRPKKPLIQSRYTHISECFLLARLRRRTNGIILGGCSCYRHDCEMWMLACVGLRQCTLEFQVLYDLHPHASMISVSLLHD